ncbi:hypothetical protein [Pseudoalteromonas sp. BDTF-M6]|uniref:hypothetical protein n=1 Tax=Pseudoalteromonas sp. BDTF-M6 TaxID=2796132 RepID=UPI001BB0924E|nr:hypothetical protein [Pseudoalteromonas sp. BDTF-M6]MBS3797092.1 hypothetical protein [Pseudoalteromonas sp. BDTF-M6]
MKYLATALILALGAWPALAESPLVAVKVDIYRMQTDQSPPNIIAAFNRAELEHQPRLITSAGKEARIEIGEQDKHLLSVTLFPSDDGEYYSANMNYKIKQQDWLQASSESEQIPLGQSVLMSSHVGEQLILMQVTGKRFHDLDTATQWLEID